MARVVRAWRRVVALAYQPTPPLTAKVFLAVSATSSAALLLRPMIQVPADQSKLLLTPPVSRATSLPLGPAPRFTVPQVFSAMPPVTTRTVSFALGNNGRLHPPFWAEEWMQQLLPPSTRLPAVPALPLPGQRVDVPMMHPVPVRGWRVRWVAPRLLDRATEGRDCGWSLVRVIRGATAFPKIPPCWDLRTCPQAVMQRRWQEFCEAQSDAIRQIDLLREASNAGVAKRVMAGIVAGLVEVSTLHPLSVVTTRLQLEGSRSVPLYRNTLHALTKIATDEGVLAIYRGYVPTALAVFPEKFVRFSIFETAKVMLLQPGESTLPLWKVSLAGACSGSLGALISCPFEVTRIVMQAHASQHPTAGRAFMHLARTEGLAGFYKGFFPLVLRDGLSGAMYFSGYYFFCSLLGRDNPSHSPAMQLALQLSAGALAGATMTCVATPLDTVKTLLMNQVRLDAAGTKAALEANAASAGAKSLEGIHFTGIRDCFTQVIRRRGVATLFAGLQPRVMRSSAAAAITFLVYEEAVEMMVTISAWIKAANRESKRWVDERERYHEEQLDERKEHAHLHVHPHPPAFAEQRVRSLAIDQVAFSWRA